MRCDLRLAPPSIQMDIKAAAQKGWGGRRQAVAAAGRGAAQKIAEAHEGAHVVCLYDGSCEQASCASSS